MPRRRKNKPDELISSSVLTEIARSIPLFVPKFDMSIEKAYEILKQLQPVPPEPLFPEIEEPYKHLPVDRHFIAMLEEMKPTRITCEKPGNVMTEEQQRQYNASRMREYRRKSNETLEKTKKMLESLKSQCTLNTVMLKNMLDSKTVEDQVRHNAAQFLNIREEDLVLIPQVIQLFQR
uniref:BZIP domain-containing protein n=1 Tax=Caenorhabditis tropicalis TaxID=1561998 RepID=A0A1I7U759_9PELO